MFYTFKQYKNLIGNLIQFLNSGELSTWLDGNEDTKREFLKDKTNEIISYLKSLDKGMVDGKIGKNDGKLSTVDFSFFSDDKKVVNKLLETIGLEKNIGIFGDDVKIEEIGEKIKEFLGERIAIKQETQKEVKKTKKEVERNKFRKERTEETVSSGQETFLGISVGGVENRNEMLKDVNIASLNSVLYKLDKTGLDNLILQITEALKKESPDSFGIPWNLSTFEFSAFKDSFGRNFSSIIPILESVGYKTDGYFGYSEAAGVVSILNDYKKTQDKLSSLKKKEKIKLLLDFNKDGELGLKVNFNVGEKEMDFFTFDSLTSDGIEALFDNLQLGSFEEFYKEMEDNLFKAREKVQRALTTAIEMGYKPAELVKQDGIKKATKEKYKQVEDVERVNIVTQQVSDYVDKKMSKLKEKERIKKELAIKAVGIVLGPDTIGAGTNIDLQKATKGFLDSLSLGFVNGQPGVAITASVLEKTLAEHDISLNVSLANFFIPAVSASKTIKQDLKEYKELFPEEIDTSLGFAISGGASLGGYTVGGAIERLDEQTSSGIEEMTKEMRKVLNGVKEDIKAGKSFTESQFGEKSENKVRDAEVYDHMKRVFNEYAKGKDFEQKFLDDMMNGALEHYKTKLYQNAEGIKLTTVGAGFVFLAGYLPLPYMMVGGEKITTKWDEVIHSVERERKTSFIETTATQAGGSIETRNGIKVLSLPIKSYANYQLSDSTGSAQFERDGKYIYVGGDIQLSDIKINENVTSEGVTYTIVVSEGVKDKSGIYQPTEEKKITESLQVKEKKALELAFYNKEAFNNTKEIRETLNTLIGHDALKHSKTKGMMKLQRMIFEYNKGQGKLEDVWKQVNNVINHSGFKEYAENKNQGNLVNTLVFDINSISSVTEKEMILQNIVMNFMKKPGLIANGEKVNLKKGTSISQYDNGKKRPKFFDDIFEREKLDIKGIQKARQKWYEKNGQAKEYTMKTQHEGIAFTGVASAKGKKYESITQIMPYPGAYNIASVEGGTDFTQIKGKMPELIEKIPNRTLEIIKKQFEKLGLTKIKSIDGVKEFIKKGGTVDGNIKIKYDLFFCKSGECLNDTIVMKNLRLITEAGEQKLGITSNGEVYSMNPDIIKGGVVVVDELRKKEEEEETGEEKGTETLPGDTGTETGTENEGTGTENEGTGTENEGEE